MGNVFHIPLLSRWFGLDENKSLLASGGVVVCVIIALTCWDIARSYVDEKKDAERTTHSLSVALADTLDSMFKQIDLGLLSLADEYEQHLKEGRSSDGVFLAAMARYDARHPEILGFRIFGPDGRLLYGLRNVVNSNSSIAGGPGFAALKDGTIKALVVGRPMMGPTAEQWLIPLLRRVNKPDGSFAGVVLAAVPVRHFETLFSALDVGVDGSIAMYHTDFQLAARIPQMAGTGNPIGKVVISEKLKSIIRSGVDASTYEYVSSVDGIERMASTKKVGDHPYVLIVALAQADYLQHWRQDSLILLASSAVMMLLVVALLWNNYLMHLEKRKAQDEIKANADRLSAVNAELEQFSYIASHDLREPLRMIISYLGLINRQLAAQLSDEQKVFLHYAVDGAKRMDALIVGLLEFSRTGTACHTEAVALSDVVGDALHTLALAIDDAHGQVTVGPDLPVLQGDRIELTRLFQNLIGNAVKYHAPDRPPKVDVQCRLQDGDWIISVADNGIGIAPEDHDRAFGVFQRLVARDQYQGTGIGLAVCKKIVEHHGGRIWIDSRLGVGTTFFVAFPAMGP